MPTYHFRCTACSKETDLKLPFGSSDKPSCPDCGKPMDKFIVPPMVHFKGSGFYKTDSTKAPEKPKEAPKPEKKPDTQK